MAARAEAWQYSSCREHLGVCQGRLPEPVVVLHLCGGRRGYRGLLNGGPGEAAAGPRARGPGGVDGMIPKQRGGLTQTRLPKSGGLRKSGCDLLIHSAAQLLTLAGGPQRGAELGRLGIIEDGALAIADGRVIAVGPTDELRRRHRSRREIDAAGHVVLPGFVDAHTHVVWMGDRAAEFELRLRGASYMEIMAAGGGIASTVRLTRQSSIEELMLAAAAPPGAHARLRHDDSRGQDRLRAGDRSRAAPAGGGLAAGWRGPAGAGADAARRARRPARVQRGHPGLR